MHGGTHVGAQPGIDGGIVPDLGPRRDLAGHQFRAGAVAKKRRANLTMFRNPSRSASACNRLSWIFGLSRGSAERSDTLPRLCGCSSTQNWTERGPSPCASRGTTAAQRSTLVPPASAGQAGPGAARCAPGPAPRSASAPGCRCGTSSTATPKAPGDRAALAVKAELAAGGESRRSAIDGPAGSRPRRAARAARGCHAVPDLLAHRCRTAAAVVAN